MSIIQKINIKHIKNILSNIPINNKEPIILVDSSYMIFYRYYATKLWYSKSGNNYESENELLECNDFMKKHNNIFFNSLNSICKKHKSSYNNVIFAYDCSYENIWRHDKEKETDNNLDNLSYKRSRRKKYKNSDFNYKKLFQNGKNDLIEKFCSKNKSSIIFHNKAEADDIIAILNNYLRKTFNNSKIIIIANDTDYLQLCDDNTHLYELKSNGTRICNKDKYLNTFSISISRGNNIIKQFDKERYLISKLLLGDKSDSISPCYIQRELLLNYNILINGTTEFVKCTNTIVNEIINSSRLYELLLNIFKNNRINGYNLIQNTDYTKNNQFTKNQYLIDMHFIPINISNTLTIMKFN